MSTRPPSQILHLILTTRDSGKGRDTIIRLEKHLELQWNPPHDILRKRLILHAENVDLTSLTTIHDLSKKLLRFLPRLDAIILNAGIGSFTIDYPAAVWQTLTDLRHAFVFPTYKIGGVGELTEPQILEEHPDVQATSLGKVFCANVFGHYLLVHQIAPLLREGRVIWISSVEANSTVFTTDDLQAISSRKAYESSKRLTDILALTSALPSTESEVVRFFSQGLSPEEGSPSIPQYVAHPAICATSIITLPIILQWAMLFMTHLVRLLGSSWSVVSPYKGACAPTWLALASDEELEEAQNDGSGKWGSAVDRWGNEKVVRTEVDGWGMCGKVEDPSRYPAKGRRPGAVDLTREAREDFEEQGRQCWIEMERLRLQWEKRMGW